MTLVGWSALRDRVQRGRRELAVIRLVIRTLRFREVEILPVGEYAIAFGYVGLWSDVRPVVKVARNVVDGTQTVAELAAALDHFDDARAAR